MSEVKLGACILWSLPRYIYGEDICTKVYRTYSNKWLKRARSIPFCYVLVLVVQGSWSRSQPMSGDTCNSAATHNEERHHELVYYPGGSPLPIIDG